MIKALAPLQGNVVEKAPTTYRKRPRPMGIRVCTIRQYDGVHLPTVEGQKIDLISVPRLPNTIVDRHLRPVVAMKRNQRQCGKLITFEEGTYKLQSKYKSAAAQRLSDNAW
jgi:hypothetical protein